MRMSIADTMEGPLFLLYIKFLSQKPFRETVKIKFQHEHLIAFMIELITVCGVAHGTIANYYNINILQDHLFSLTAYGTISLLPMYPAL